VCVQAPSIPPRRRLRDGWPLYPVSLLGRLRRNPRDHRAAGVDALDTAGGKHEPDGCSGHGAGLLLEKGWANQGRQVLAAAADSTRASRLTQSLLERIEQQAEVMILDVSGVPAIDTTPDRRHGAGRK
jgi:hypothetical protein